MTIQRAAVPAPQTNLFAPASPDDWGKEMEFRNQWAQNLKTVEAAKDKTEGLKARAKGKRGGDASKCNQSSLGYENDAEHSVSRREYQFKPSHRNPIMAGNMAPEEYRPGVKQVPPPKEKRQPKTHKVVNLSARCGTLMGSPGASFAYLAGAVGEHPSQSPQSRGRRVLGRINMETQPPPQRPTGKAGRRSHTESTEPWRFVKDNNETDQSVDYRQRYVQRYGSTPEYARKMHTFAAEPKQPRYPNYRPCPPYSVGEY